MKCKSILFLGLFALLFGSVFGKEIPIDQARLVAKNFIYEKTGVKANDINFVEETITDGNHPLYYVFNIEPKGFVLVSAEDNFYPIIGYSFDNKFVTENQPENIKFWLNKYEQEITYVRQTNTTAPESDLWAYYNVSFDDFSEYAEPNSKDVVVEPLTGDILWNQDAGWNEACPEDSGGPDGHVYTGCVATAMGIIMKYWNYPINGTGNHSYYSTSYGMLSANFGNTTYMWSYMHNSEANWYSALLLYHCGVSVNMSYGPTGSGAYSFNVDDALEAYFGYSTSVQYVEKDNYTLTNWMNLLKTNLNNSQPIYYSGNDGTDGHAFVCDGYDDTDMFHFNFGWSGYANGYYALSDVNGFIYGQAANINIIPAGTYDYPASPNTLTANVDTNDLTSFKVDLEWTAPAAKALTGYDLYREDVLIAEDLSTSTLTYTDIEAEPGDHKYAIRAIYSDGISLCTPADLDGSYQVKFFVKDINTNSNLTTATVIFNGQSTITTFAGAIFNGVPFGQNYEYEVSYNGYYTANGIIDYLYKNITLTVYLSPVGIEEQNSSLIVAYPNPTYDLIYLDGLENNNIVEIFDMSGKSVLKQINVIDKSEIDLSSLGTGVYTMKISNGNNTINHKIVKK